MPAVENFLFMNVFTKLSETSFKATIPRLCLAREENRGKISVEIMTSSLWCPISFNLNLSVRELYHKVTELYQMDLVRRRI